MRLRKLILSTGLAVAMVATTIPVGATPATQTGKIYKGSTESVINDAFKETLPFMDADTEATTVSGNVKKLTSTVSTPAQGNEAIPDNPTDSKFADYASANGVTIEKLTIPGTLTASQDTVYTCTVTYKLTDADVNKTVADLVDAKDKAALDELKAVTDELIDTTAVDITGGTKQNAYKSSSNPAKDATASKWDSNPQDASQKVVAEDVGKAYTAVATATITTSYKISDVSSTGYTFKYMMTGLPETDNNGLKVEYSVLDWDPENMTLTEHESEFASGVLTYYVTALDHEYYYAKKAVSTKDALELVEPTDTGYIYTIQQKEAPSSDTVKGIFDKAVKDNSFNLVAYLDLSVRDAATNKVVEGKAFEFKIGIPTDIGTEGVTYKVLRLHGTATTPDILDTTISEDGKYIVFTTDQFSDYALVTVAADAETPADPKEEQQQEEQQQEDTQNPTTLENTKGGSDKADTGVKSGDNSMMPIVVVSLLLALCAGSVAVYKEKKTL